MTKNPNFAHVGVEISLFDALSAIEHFAEAIPEDRCSRFVSDRLEAAARKIADKADATRMKDIKAAAAKLLAGELMSNALDFLRAKLTTNPVFNVGGCLSGRSDSTKENYGNTPKGAVELCRKCLTYHEEGRFCLSAKACTTKCNHPDCKICNPTVRWVEADETYVPSEQNGDLI